MARFSFIVFACILFAVVYASEVDDSKKCKGPHEIYIDCPAGQCNPKTCDDLVTPPGCPRIIPPCPGGCVCEDGYLRDSKGICIKEEDCPTTRCRGANEVYDCRPEYEWEKCEDRFNSPPFNPGNTKCRCYCRRGYWRDDRYKCVKPEQCPCPKQCKGPHEKYIHYPVGHGQRNPKTCDDLVTPPGCPRIKPPCPGYCVCEDGYLRNSTGTCIKKEQCRAKQCKGPHEKYIHYPVGHGQRNPKTCDDLVTPPGCPRIKQPCPGYCVCDDGYLRNSTGICIKKEQCGAQ